MSSEHPNIWQEIQSEAQAEAAAEPLLASFFHATIINHDNLEDSLSFHLANKLSTAAASAMQVREIIQEALTSDPSIGDALRCDLVAFNERDSACPNLSTPFLFYKGFHALQSHRVAHWLWNNDRRQLALFLQNRISVAFGVDIHPASRVGRGIFFDHATAIVIGETATVADNVSIMQSVTLGGTGKESGDRHPKIGAGVLIGPGATILGNIPVGTGAKICGGSVVLKPVEEFTVVAGVPAKKVGDVSADMPAMAMIQCI